MQIYVVGIGNTWASDDAIGPKVVRQLQAKYPVSSPATGHHHENGSTLTGGAQAPPTPKEVTFVTLSQPAVELIDLMQACDILVLVDAVSSGAPPGAIHRQEWRPGLLDSRGVERASSHGLGVRELLDLAAKLNQLPNRVILWGIEAASTEPGPEISAAVAKAVPNLVDQLGQEVERIQAIDFKLSNEQ